MSLNSVILRASILGAACVATLGTCAQAAEQTRSYLIERFQDGDIPTGQDFASLLDSCLNLSEDGLTSFRVGGTSSAALRLDAGMVIGPATAWTAVSNYPSLAPQWLGEFGFLPMVFRDAALQPHFGYFQLRMAAGPLPPEPGSPLTPGTPIMVEYLVWETSANTLVSTQVIPAPMSATVLCGGLLLMGRRRR